MLTSDIISIGVLAMLVANAAVGVFLITPYTKLKEKYDSVQEERTRMYVMADKYQAASLDLIEKLDQTRKDVQRLEKEVEVWKARSIS